MSASLLPVASDKFPCVHGLLLELSVGIGIILGYLWALIKDAIPNVNSNKCDDKDNNSNLIARV